MKNKGNVFVVFLILCLLLGCSNNDDQTVKSSETISIIEGTYIVRAEDREKEVLENTADGDNSESVINTEEVTVENTETSDDSDEKDNDEPVEEKKESDKQPKEEPKQPSAPVHTHAYSEAITANPTCTSNGVKTFTCSCGHSYTEAIAANGHHYNSSVTVNSTCTTAGVRTYICSCGSSYTEAIATSGHNYVVDAESPATCGCEGYRYYVCNVCWNAFYDEIIPATGNHNWGHYSKTVNDVLVEEYDYCTVCNEQRACTGCALKNY